MLILEHHMSDTNILLAMILQNDANYKEVKEYLKTQYLRYVSENTKKEAEFKISNIRNISLHVSEYVKDYSNENPINLVKINNVKHNVKTKLFKQI